MKFQPKRFVVEVKRGTNRASFSSVDAGLDKFSSAEAMLFGGSPAPATANAQSKSRSTAEAPRRILESLIEPPPPPPAAEDLIDRPRRGRKPGSKNRPKFATGSTPVSALPLSAEALAFMKGPEAASDGPGGWDHDPASERRMAHPVSSAEAANGSVPTPGQGRHARLRDRSSILKRYVLGTEPKPGGGSTRAHRRARRPGL